MVGKDLARMLRLINGESDRIDRWSDEDWKVILRRAVRSVEELSQQLGFPSVPSNWIDDPKFPVRVPQPYLARIEPRKLEDPLLLQVVPTLQERQVVEGFYDDPLVESEALIGRGVLQKYQGRVLLISTPVCAVHCRYCFRRNFPYEEHRSVDLIPQLKSIEQDPTIREVILSGGDPLMLSDNRLARAIRYLDAIPHVRRIRIHTRLPVVIPQRITSKLRELLRSLQTKIVLVMHFNHANEIDADVSRALAMLHEDGIPLFNQSVLLKGVNDSVAALVSLSETLFENHVVPYYLHLLDRVSGTAHYEVDEQVSSTLYAELQAQLPGYLVPKLVREVPGEPAKQIQFV